MDIYKCEICGKIFDEFEMDYRKAQIDKKELCDDCRKNGKSLIQIETENEIGLNIFL